MYIKNLFLLSLIVIFSNFNFLFEAKSDIIKPDKKILPNEVVEIQLNSLMKNDFPTKDIGIIQTWEFAHPINQKNTGPLNNFKKMLKGENYSMLLNHDSIEKHNPKIPALKLVVWHPSSGFYQSLPHL